MSQPTESVTQTFGSFSNDLLIENQCLLINFASGLVPQQQFWPNSSLSAKFIADYLTMFFPVNSNELAKQRQQTEIKDTVRYIVNELLENAVKFSDPTSQRQPQLGLHIHPGTIVMYVTNSSQADHLSDFKALIHKLTTSDPVALYIERLEQNLDTDNGDQSGLGFITILSNYDTLIGWKIEPIPKEPGKVIVTTMVQLLYDWDTWIDCLDSLVTGMQHGN